MTLSRGDARKTPPWLTEARNPAAMELDECDSLGVVTLMNREDARVLTRTRRASGWRQPAGMCARH